MEITRPHAASLHTQNEKILNFTVIVAALGYFVDIYDLLLFGIVRVPSLMDLGVAKEDVLNIGIQLLNMQMIGMLIGGIVWGIVGDRKGRLSVLFGSILLYSLANIANAFVTSIPMYSFLRLIAGIGLAGELGAAITLVSETMSKERRGFGTMIVAAVGISGAVVAGLIGDYFHWKTAYIIGGCLGLLLLLLRISVMESGMFEGIKESSVNKGDFLALFKERKRCLRYLACILIGVPVWFTIGILITFSPEIAQELQVNGLVLAGKAIMFAYAGLSVGDIASGLFSQLWKSRKKVIFLFICLTYGFVLYYYFSRGIDVHFFYFICALLGFSNGYWAVFITNASEQFGTNLRATVTTTVPNFVRGSVVPLTLSFRWLSGHMSLLNSALVLGSVVTVLALVAAVYLEETFHKDLNYLENI